MANPSVRALPLSGADLYLKHLGYASLDAPQEIVVADVTRDKTVLDIGCGEGAFLARWVLSQGAASVLAVDTALPYGIQDRPSTNTRLSLVHATFERLLDQPSLPSRFDVGLLSWPSNHESPGLLPLLERCDRLVVISCNVASTVCGSSTLWMYLLRRQSQQVLIHRRNVVLVYGAPMPEVRPALVEERLGIANALGHPPVSFEQAYPHLVSPEGRVPGATKP